MLWRVSVPPASGGAAAERLMDVTGGRVMMDWAGGLIWLQITGSDAMAQQVRDIAGASDGQAVLVRAPTKMRESIAVFHPENAALARINAKLRQNFDPEGILNPGRLSPPSANGEGA